MVESIVNPYGVQSPSTDEDLNSGSLDDAAGEVTFRWTKSVSRHAVDHLLLHRHPIRLSVGSLLMILASGVAIFWSANQSVAIFLPTVVTAMSLTTGIYLLLVRRSKSIMRRRIADLGLVENSVCVVGIQQDQFVLISSTGRHHWKRSEVVHYRTPFGVVFCPESMTAIYVPRKNNSPTAALATLRRQLSSTKHLRR